MIHIEFLSSEVISAPCPHCLFSRDTLCLPHALKQLLASLNATSRFSNNYTTIQPMAVTRFACWIHHLPHLPYLTAYVFHTSSWQQHLHVRWTTFCLRLHSRPPSGFHSHCRVPEESLKQITTQRQVDFVNWMIRNIYHLKSRWRPMYWFVIAPSFSHLLGVASRHLLSLRGSCEAVPATSTALAKATPTARPVSSDVVKGHAVCGNLLHLSSDNLCFFASNTTNQPIIFQQLLLSGSNRCSIRTPPTC